jgi:hypothetical protein
MRQPRVAARRPRRRSRRRVVTAQRAAVSRTAYGAWPTWDAGIAGARLLLRHFPETYAFCLAGRRCTPQLLAGAGYAFLSLADQHLVALNGGWMKWHTMPASFAIEDASKLTDQEALGRIDRQIKPWIYEPVPLLYGLGKNIDELPWESSIRLLTGACWMLLDTSPWSVLDDWYDDGNLENFIASVTYNEQERRQLERIKPLPPVNVLELRDVLNRRMYMGVRRLGDILAFAVGQTGAEMADFGNEEMEELGAERFSLAWDDPASIAAHRESQVEARGYFERFLTLSEEISRTPALLDKLVRSIHRQAKKLFLKNTPPPRPRGRPIDLEEDRFMGGTEDLDDETENEDVDEEIQTVYAAFTPLVATT